MRGISRQGPDNVSRLSKRREGINSAMPVPSPVRASIPWAVPAAALAVASLLLAGCAVGPDFKAPAPPAVAQPRPRDRQAGPFEARMTRSDQPGATRCNG